MIFKTNIATVLKLVAHAKTMLESPFDSQPETWSPWHKPLVPESLNCDSPQRVIAYIFCITITL